MLVSKNNLLLSGVQLSSKRTSRWNQVDMDAVTEVTLQRRF